MWYISYLKMVYQLSVINSCNDFLFVRLIVSSLCKPGYSYRFSACSSVPELFYQLLVTVIVSACVHPCINLCVFVWPCRRWASPPRRRRRWPSTSDSTAPPSPRTWWATESTTSLVSVCLWVVGKRAQMAKHNLSAGRSVNEEISQNLPSVCFPTHRFSCVCAVAEESSVFLFFFYFKVSTVGSFAALLLPPNIYSCLFLLHKRVCQEMQLKWLLGSVIPVTTIAWPFMCFLSLRFYSLYSLFWFHLWHLSSGLKAAVISIFVTVNEIVRFITWICCFSRLYAFQPLYPTCSVPNSSCWMLLSI